MLPKLVNLLEIRPTSDGVTDVALSPDGQRIASGGVDSTLRVWDAGTTQPVDAPLTGHTGEVTSVAFQSQRGPDRLGQ